MRNENNTVLIEPLWMMRREFTDLLREPPAGYRFLLNETGTGSAHQLARFNFTYTLFNSVGKLFPHNLFKSWLQQFSAIPSAVDLVYAVSHPVFRKHPWVIDMRAEQPHIMAGGEWSFDWCRNTIHRLFTSPYCRAVIYEVEAGKRAFLQRLRAPELEPKVKIVPTGVPRRDFTKIFRDDKVKLIFVNSANINAAWNFALKGGKILLEAFKQIKKDYPHVELFIRAEMPEDLKLASRGIPGLRIADKPLPWSELEQEFQTADIFVMPTFVTPSLVFLDAMSYELPVITTSVWANPEYIRDGYNGLLITNTLAKRYTDGDIVHFDSPAYRRALQTVDKATVVELTAKLKLLIDNTALRRRMGAEGRSWVEKEHSLAAWRNGLKQVFDDALDYRG